MLTEGDITQEGTPKRLADPGQGACCSAPVALIGVTSTAYMALSRGSGQRSLDITLYAEGGTALLGTPAVPDRCDRQVPGDLAQRDPRGQGRRSKTGQTPVAGIDATWRCIWTT